MLLRPVHSRSRVDTAREQPAPRQMIDATASPRSLANRLEAQGLTGLIVVVCL
jgi:hypothetical protein